LGLPPISIAILNFPFALKTVFVLELKWRFWFSLPIGERPAQLHFGPHYSCFL